MSTLKVTIEKIGEIKKHPNADRLEVAKLQGVDYQFCVQKDQFKVGDNIVYIPIDSLLPQALSDYLGVTNYLKRGTVKTAKLRGVISQGIVTTIESVCSYLSGTSGVMVSSLDAVDITEALGVTKYEPPIETSREGEIFPLPGWLSKYDLENAERQQDLLAEMLQERCLITEKIEGTNFSVSFSPLTQSVYVCQRNFSIRENDTNMYWAAAKKYGLIDKVKQIHKDFYNDKEEPVTIYGELCGPGIMSVNYGFKDKRILCFDMRVGSFFLNQRDSFDIFMALGVDTVPILSSGMKLGTILGERTIKQMSDGASIFNSSQLREGVVISSLEKTYDDFGHRRIIKQRSPEYLARYD